MTERQVGATMEADRAADPAGVGTRPVEAPSGPVVDVTMTLRSARLERLVSWVVEQAEELAPGGLDDRRVLALVEDTDLDVVGPLVTAGIGALGIDSRIVTVTTVERFAETVVSEFGALAGTHAPSRARRNRVVDDGERFTLVTEAIGAAELEAVLDLRRDDLVGDALVLMERLGRSMITVEHAMAWQLDRLGRFDQQLTASSRPTLDQLRVREVARQRVDLLAIAGEYERIKRSRGLRDRADERADAVALLHRRDVGALIADRHPAVAVHVVDSPDIIDRAVVDAATVASDRMLIVRGPSSAGVRDAVVGPDDAGVDPESELGRLWRVLQGQRVPHPGAAARDARSEDRRPPETHPGGAALRLVMLGDTDEEVSWVSERILAGLEAGFEPSSIAVVSPDRRILLGLADRLRRAEVDVDLAASDHRGSPVFWEIMALLRLAADPDDAVSAARVLRGPRFGLTREDLAAFAVEAQRSRRGERRADAADPSGDTGFMQGLRSPYASPPEDVEARVKAFLADVDAWALAMRSHGLPIVLDQMLDEHGLTLSLLSRPDADASEDLAAVQWIRCLAGTVGSWERPGGVDALVNRMLHGRVVDDGSVPDGVRLLTPATAAGQSVDHLFIVGSSTPPASDDPFWDRQRTSSDETMLDARSSIPAGLSPFDTVPVDIADPDTVEEHRRDAALAGRRRWEATLAGLVAGARQSLAVTHAVWQRDADGAPRSEPQRSELFDRLTAAGLRIRSRGTQPIPTANPLQPTSRRERSKLNPVSDLERSIRGGVSSVAAHRTLDADEHAAVVEVDRIIEELAEAEHSDQIDVGRNGQDGGTTTGREALHPIGLISEIEFGLTDPDAHRRSVHIGVPEVPAATHPRGLLFRRWLDDRAVVACRQGTASSVPRPWATAQPAPTLDETPEIRPLSIDGEVFSRQGRGDATSTFPSIGSDAELDRLADLYLMTAYASWSPAEVLIPVSLTLRATDDRPARLLRGTVDAIHDHADGRWEMVEVRAGMPHEAPWAALAAKALPLVRRGRSLGQCRLTIVWLADEATIETRPCPSAEAIMLTIDAIL